MAGDSEQEPVRSPDGREWHVYRVWALGPESPPDPVDTEAGWGVEFLDRWEARVEPLLRWRTAVVAFFVVAVLATVSILLGAPTETVVIVAVVVVGAIPMAFFVFELWLFVVMLPILVVVAIGIALYYAFRIGTGRPWTIEAVCVGPPRTTMRWKVCGWRRSGRAVDEIREALIVGDFSFAPPGSTGFPETRVAAETPS